MGSVEVYSVQEETQKIFYDGILRNPNLNFIPSELKDLSKHVRFTGSPQPSVPINWRFAESAAALKAFEASMLNLLITKKYGVPPVTIEINTDRASLYSMSPVITRIVDEETGEIRPFPWHSPEADSIFPSQDLHNSHSELHRILATNIYKTADNRYYHTHGSMKPEPTLTALGLPLHGSKDDNYETVTKRIQSAVSQHHSTDLDTLMNGTHRQAGTIAYSSSEYFSSPHGKAHAHIDLYSLSQISSSQAPQPASWWPESPSVPSSPARPLAGLKVLDLTRVIAAPSITRSLAQMGASVMRVTSDKVTDMSSLFHDLSWGKWQCRLHLKHEGDREKLREMIGEADVVVEGYRPGVAERLGFSRSDILSLIKDRDRGIVHVKENCYGWHGEWSHRSGWQQISDACCGVSLEYGRAMGNDEAVTPVFPNSDFCTGISGTTGVLHALIERASKGGSYAVDVSLNYYSQWLVRSVGTYPPNVWNELWSRHGSPVFRHWHNMGHTIPAMIKLLHEYDEEVLFREEFFEKVRSEVVGRTFVQVAPVAKMEGVKLGYTIGVRGNGLDQPKWPDDLTVQIVK